MQILSAVHHAYYVLRSSILHPLRLKQVNKQDQFIVQMPFWNRGNSDPSPPAEQSFSDSSSGFETGPDMSGGSLGGGGLGGGEMQQFALQMRQQMMVQNVINNLTDKAFEKCMTSRPGDSLGGKEAACVHATVNKWLDTNEFMMGRLQKKQQAQAGQQSFA